MDKLKLAIHHTHHEDEQLGPDSTAMELDEGPRVREAARERGLAPRTDGSTTLNLPWAQLHEMSSSTKPWDEGTGAATDTWLAGHLNQSIAHDGSEEAAAELTESINRASKGLIKINPNTRAGPEQLEATRHLETIRTREQFHELITRSYNEQPAKALAPGYLKSRTTYVKQWESMMREGFGALPWRLCWAMDLSKQQHRREENYLLAFFTLCRIRFKTFAAAEQAISHVVQFHLTHLDLAPPPFPRLYNRLRLARRGAKKDEASRKRRPYIKPEYVSAIAAACSAYVANTHHALNDRIAVCALWGIVTAGFSLLFRVGELARGAEFTPRRHWTLGDMRPLAKLKPGTNHCVRQPQRKVPGEFQQEALPISFWDNPECFALAARTKLKLHGTSANAELDLFSIDSAGSSPTPGWVGGRLKAITRVLFPSASQGMDF